MLLAAAAALMSLVLTLVIRSHVLRNTSAHTTTLADAPARPLAIVLGARIWGDQPSHMLEDRLHAALQLYQSGRCEKLLLSGAHHRDDYDEVTVMRRWLEQRGVAPEDLFLDHAGLRTFDSMVRAKQVFGAERVLVVSQDFHVPRAVYIGRSVGLDTIGVVAPAHHEYSPALRRHNALREHLAQTRAWLDVHVFATRPRHGAAPDETIDLRGSGETTH